MHLGKAIGAVAACFGLIVLPATYLNRIQPAGILHQRSTSIFGTASAAEVSRVISNVRSSSKLRVLYNFGGPPDGAQPQSRLIDIGGALYGTTYAGGSNNLGTVFAVTSTGTERFVYSFKGMPDGANPAAGLVNLNGTLYGTTAYGGVANCTAYSRPGCGTVFSVSQVGTESVVYRFQNLGTGDGATPFSELMSINGAFYGTTFYGGYEGNNNVCMFVGCGTIFELLPTGVETVLTVQGGPPYGSHPVGTVIAVSGNLYGTAGGGVPDEGVVYGLTPSGSESLVHTFTGKPDGQIPFGTFDLINKNGTLLGVTGTGGAYNFGAVFSVSTSGAENIIYSFKGPPDGAFPLGRLNMVDNKLYGVTEYGGNGSCHVSGSPTGCGTIFSIDPSGTETVVHSFKMADGTLPLAGMREVNGTFYGTTQYGGAGPCKVKGEPAGCGTVFALTP